MTTPAPRSSRASSPFPKRNSDLAVPTSPAAESGLEVRQVSKQFGDLTALDQVSATFVPGEIHAVLGENGAGKSTLMNILGGFLRPDSGTVTLNGQTIPVADPIACRRLGIEMIHQHFMLVPAFTVAENLALNRLPGLACRLDESKLTASSLRAAEGLDWKIDAGAVVRDLTVGAQQRLEIIKSLGGEARVFIFDEPTAVLSPAEVDELFVVLRKLRDSGAIVILIAHKLNEVFAVANRVTVLRRGKYVATSPIAEVTRPQLANWMVGEFEPVAVAAPEVIGDARVTADAISIRGDRGDVAVTDVSFEIRSGEIVGFGGVEGNGQDELAEALAGVRPVSGQFNVVGTVGYVPEDRQVDGLALGLSVEENLLITGVKDSALVRRGFLRQTPIHRWAEGLIEKYSIKVTSRKEPVGSLSGGNQQKVVVARALASLPEVLVVVNPTRGLDLRATQFVHESILRAAAAGTAVALFSTDLDELQALSTRKFFMSGGKLADAKSAESYFGVAA